MSGARPVNETTAAQLRRRSIRHLIDEPLGDDAAAAPSSVGGQAPVLGVLHEQGLLLS